MSVFRAFTIVGVLLLGGCATATQTLELGNNPNLQLSGKQLHVVHERPDPFLPMTYSKGVMGVLGVTAAIAEGKTYVKDISLQDPSIAIENQLAQYTLEKYNLAGAGQTFDFIPTSKPGDVISWAKNKKLTGLILDVETRGWSYIYDGFNISDYIVGYNGKLQLIDIERGKVIASHQCAKDTKTLQNGKVYRHEDLIANNGALLKELYGFLSQACIDEFKAKAL